MRDAATNRCYIYAIQELEVAMIEIERLRGYMHCPNCGTEISKNQKFCRSCGMVLQMISEAAAKHLSTADFAESPDESEASKQRRMSIRTLEPSLRDKSHTVVRVDEQGTQL
jgi:hypothetical protein